MPGMADMTRGCEQFVFPGAPALKQGNQPDRHCLARMRIRQAAAFGAKLIEDPLQELKVSGVKS
jgi:hypothetical protein